MLYSSACRGGAFLLSKIIIKSFCEKIGLFCDKIKTEIKKTLLYYVNVSIKRGDFLI